MTNAYEVIIIGTGAGGGTLARQLAPSGKRILLLERGDYLPRDYVGGARKVYGAALYRLRAKDFGQVRHHDGISPAWPIPYETMEPYYTRAEQLYQVHGVRGEDPTDPGANAPYPHPAVSHEPRIQQLSDDLARAGHHPFHAPCGILLDEADPPYRPCVRCSTSDGCPCLVHAKSDAEVLAVRPALEFANVTLLTRAMAVRLETNPTGTAVTEVVVEHGGRLERFSADIVVVSCGAANSAKLLLRSASDKHPSGLANGSDELGRNYMCHHAQPVLALSKQPNPTVFARTLGLNDFYFSGPEHDYPLGSVQLSGRSRAPMYRGDKHLEATLSATWSLADVARHAVDFWLSTEDLPQSDNRVTLDPDANIRLRYQASNRTAANRLYQQVKSMLGIMGMHPEHLIPRSPYLKSEYAVAAVAHRAGTCRFGTDPTSSVLDLDCRAHELDNLYVVDASFLPSIGAVSPALTVMANAIRVGDHLLERLGATEPAALAHACPPDTLEATIPACAEAGAGAPAGAPAAAPAPLGAF